jgi:hypothetical protein
MKFNADQARADLKARIARRNETQTQILTDQASNAKRSAKAIRAEAAWYAKQGKV